MGAEGTVTTNTNELSVILFLLGLAVNFLIPTFRQEQQKVRIVLRAAAALLVVVAVIWPFLSPRLPVFSSSMTSLASNAWAWFGLLVMMWVASLLLPVIEQKNVSQNLLASGATVERLSLSPNEIIYPKSKNGVLWKFVEGAGMTGPFCPTHKVRLFYWPVHGGGETAEFKEEDYLSGNGNFVCTIDREEFTFIRPGTLKINRLRASAMEQFQIEQDRRRLAGEKKSQ